jgi:transcriptional regulator with XRE-family HTH domain
MSQKSTSHVDKIIGSRIRARRLMAGMTQERLAEALNITFQQVQKYEKGANRVTVSRMIEIAKALDVEVTSFLDGAAIPGGKAEALLSDKETVQLVCAFNAIKSARARQAVLDIARALAGETSVEHPQTANWRNGASST